MAMSYLVAVPEMMTAAATDLAALGSNVSAAHMAAAAPTVAVLPAAADEVSAGIAHLFSQHAANYQAMAAQAAAFQERFVQNLTAGAFSYADIESMLASSLQDSTGSASIVENRVISLTGRSPEEWFNFAVFILLLPVLIPLLIAYLLFLVYKSLNPVWAWQNGIYIR